MKTQNAAMNDYHKACFGHKISEVVGKIHGCFHRRVKSQENYYDFLAMLSGVGE